MAPIRVDDGSLLLFALPQSTLLHTSFRRGEYHSRWGVDEGPDGVTDPLLEDDLGLHHPHAVLADTFDYRPDGHELVAAVDDLHPVALVDPGVLDQDGLAVGDPALLLRIGADLLERHRDGVEGDERGRVGVGSESALDLRGLDRLVHVEAPDLNAAQAGEMGDGAQAVAELVRERSGVGAGSASQAEPEAVARELAGRLEGPDMDRLGLLGNRLSAAGELVELHAADLGRAVRRRGLVEIALELLHRLGHPLGGEAFRRRLLGHRPRRVVGVGGLTEADVALVHLGRADEKPREAGAPAEREQEKAGSVGIERAAVADLFLPDAATHLLHHVVRGATAFLVDQEEAVPHAVSVACSACSSESSSAATSRRSAAISPVISKPAAARWPPPPCLRAMRSTSTPSPRLRSETLTRLPSRTRSRATAATPSIERG